MNQDKHKRLNVALDGAMNIVIGLEPMAHLDDFFAPKLMVIGTATDEKTTSLADFRKMIENQQRQTEGMDVRFARSEVYRDYSADENVAVIVEDIVISITIDTEAIQFDIRSSVVLEFKNHQWKVIHWHASKPEPVESETDTFGIDEWKQKAEELEKLVAERTSDLVHKNRELEIESSLERVRSVAMNMRKPDDLLSITEALFNELRVLGFSDLRNAMIHRYFDEKSEFLDYDFSDFSSGQISRIPYSGNPEIERFIQNIRKTNESFTEFVVTGKQLEDWKEFRKSNGEFDDPRLNEVSALYYYNYSIGTASIGISTFSPVSDDKQETLKRFRNVFDFAYKRYTDVAQAEADAKEAQIEAALERVRSQTMAMHNSEDVGKCIVKMFSEVTALGVDEGTRFGIGILNHDNENNQVWTASKEGEEVKMHIGHLEMTWHPLLQSARRAWKERVSLHTYVLEGEDLLNYYQMLNNAPDYKYSIAIEKLPEREFHYGFVFDHGFFYAFTPREFQPDLIHIVQRFSSLFGQTYRRYLDLVTAEGQAREAQIEVALERVRSRTMAMQHSDELADASFVLDNQVRALGIKTRGCAFTIYGENESTEWFSSERGTLPTYIVPREAIFARYYEAGQRGESMYIESFVGETCQVHYDYLCTLPILGEALKELKASGGSFPEQQVDHATYFKYGYLLFITLEPVPEVVHDIFKRFAKVFEQTYTRFLDLQKAEAHAELARQNLILIQLEKQRAQDALTALKATQAQLIQAEKMASLGELTAGIAHEIQNPLNFVNNFSEVSAELVQELEEAQQMPERDAGLEAELLGDVKQNLEKIFSQGQRASAIVQAMLEHSRTSTGEREPTDLNHLAEEYLRMAYEGMRAKDKTYSCELATDFDTNLGTVDLVSSEIGRVLLNLYSNAFYAVREKQKTAPTDYQPTITVSTRQVAEAVKIRISDNGTGIPHAVKEKIFQPFFTTKPTGSGTGLGLSLSYDIVTKGHGGTLTVESVEGEGSVFVIGLPGQLARPIKGEYNKEM